jgi:poly-gamma-glutamate synthesis protein (capsule biosynthesis protein)
VSTENIADGLRLSFVGDVMLGRGVNRMLEHRPPDYPWGDTLALLRRSDWRACNLECVISDHGEPWSDKAFHFRSDAKNAAVLGVAGINAVSLANNHSLDFGYRAMQDMLRTLDERGISHAGAGMNSAAAFEPAVSTVHGKRISLIAFTDNEPEWEATDRRPGVAYLPVDARDDRAQRLLRVVEQARRNSDLVVVSAHWGPNWGYEPPKEHVRFGRHLIDSGADIVFGHSGHVFRGIELYRERVILYCAGNFIDDYAVDETERNDESFVFEIGLDREARPQQLWLYPTTIDDCQACMAGRRAEAIATKMMDLCSRLGTRSAWNQSGQRLEIRVSEPSAKE